MAKQAWFRLYAEFATDPKVQSMSETFQRRFIMLLCFQCNDDLVSLDEDELAFAMRISSEDLQSTKQVFMQKGFIDPDWTPLAWDKRQYKSDTSTDRVRRFRDKNKQPLPKQKGNVSETPPDTDTETDTEEALKELFGIFYSEYPLKKSKAQAEKAFRKLNPDEHLMQQIMQAIHAQAKERAIKKQAGEFVPEWKHPATWLNARAWEDEVDISPRTGGSNAAHQREDSQSRGKRLRAEAERNLDATEGVARLGSDAGNVR